MKRNKRMSVGSANFSRRLICLAVASAFGGAVHANPTGPAVAHGQATFSQSGNTLSITNSPNAIINWRSFSIGATEATRFIQQSSSSAVLNRVIGVDPSIILGTLQSNGKVFLINPSGVLFGQGSRIDVAGLVASTLNISDQDFLAGRLNFTAGAVTAGGLSNQGTITTPSGGSVILIAPQIENSGIINAPNGDVILAAGRSVRLGDTGAPNVLVEIQAPDTQAVNVGQIVAAGGSASIYAGLIQQKGIVRADSASLDASGRIVFRASKDVTLAAGSTTSASGASGGRVTIQAQGGTDLVYGDVSATGSNGMGGVIQLLGTQVGVAGNATVNASGASGGGSILVGGDYRGSNPDVQNARATYLGTNAGIFADAIGSGNGGKVVVWSDESTRVFGVTSAKGGAQSGNGGFIEISSKGWLDFRASANTSAPRGKAGSLLLDPTDVDIVAVDTGTPDTLLAGDEFIDTGPVAASEITLAALSGALTNGDVTISTNNTTGTGTGNINWKAGANLNYNGLGSRTLTLNANNNITLGGNVTDSAAGGDVMNLVLNPGASGVTNIESQLALGGGTLRIGGTGAATLAGSANISGATISRTGAPVTAASSVSLGGVTLDTDFIVDNNAQLVVTNGLTINTGRTLTLGATTGNSLAYFEGTQTLGGNGTVALGVAGGGGLNAVYAELGTLTIDAGITIHTGAAGVVGFVESINAARVVNLGKIAADQAGGSITITGFNWSSAADSVLEASAGGVLNLAGTFPSTNLGGLHNIGSTVNLTGTMDNTAGYTLDDTHGSLVLKGGQIAGGTLANIGATSQLIVQDSPTLSGVTLDMDLRVDNNQQLIVTDGLTINTGRTLTLGATTGISLVYFEGTQTLGGGGTVALGVAGGGGLNAVYAELGTLTIDSGITIHTGATGVVSAVQSVNTAQIINQGKISADQAGGSLTVGGGSVINAGKVSASNGGALTADAGFATNAGILDIGSGSTLTIGSGNLTNAVTGLMNVSGTVDGAGHTLTNEGTLTLINGAIRVPLINSGAANGFGNITMEAGLSNSGTLTLEPNATLGLSGTSNNTSTGTINIWANDGAGGAGFTTLTMSGEMVNAGTIDLRGDAANGYFASLNLDGATLTNSGVIRSTLAGTGTVSPVNSMTLSGLGSALTNTGTVQVDQVFNVFVNSGQQVDTSGGTLQVASGQVLQFSNSGTVVVGSTSFGTGTGTVGVNGGILNVASDVTVGAGAAALNLASTTVDGAGSLTNQGALALYNSTVNVATVNAVTGVMQVTGSNTVSAAFSNAGTVTVGQASSLALNGISSNGGTLNLLANDAGNVGNSALTVGGTLNNTGTIELRGDASSAYIASIGVTGTLTNSGLIKSTLAGTGAFSPINLISLGGAGASVTNTGTIQADQMLTANLQFGDNVFDTSGGTLQVASGQTLQFSNGGTVVVGSTSFGTGTGTVGVSSGILNVASDVTVGAGAASLSLAGTTVNGAGALTNQGTLTLNNSIINVATINAATGVVDISGSNSISEGFSNAGTVTVGPFSSLNLDGTSSNGGTLNLWANNGVTNGFSVLNVGGNLANSGTIELRGDAVSGYTATISVTGTLANSGLIKSTLAGTGANLPVNVISLNGAGVSVTNTGTIQADQMLTANLQFGDNVFDTSGGTLQVASAQTLQFSNGGKVIAGTTSFGTGTGTVGVSGGILEVTSDLTVGAGTVSLNLASTTVNGAGTLTNQGSLTLNNSNINVATINTATGVVDVSGSNNISAGFSNAGTVTVGPFSSLTLDGTSSNSGTLNLWANNGVTNGFSALAVDGTLANTGTIELRGDAVSGYTATISVTGALANSGLIKSTLAGIGANSPANAVSLDAAGVSVTNTGTIQVDQSLNAHIAFSDAVFDTSGGTLQVASGQTLQLSNGGKLIVGTTSFGTGTGTVGVSGGILEVASDVTVGAGTAALSLVSTTVNGAGILTNQGTLTLNNSNINVATINTATGVVDASGNNSISEGFSNAGTVTVGPFSSLVLDGTSSNSGTLNLWANNGVTNGFSALNVGGNLANTGTIELRGDAVSGYTSLISVTGALANSGLIKSTLAGAGVNLPANAVSLDAAGALVTNTGTIQVDQSLNAHVAFSDAVFNTSGGTLQVAAGQTLQFSNGGTVVAGTTSFGTGTGTVGVSGGILNLASDVTVGAGTASLNLASTTVNGAGTLTNQGALTVNNSAINVATINTVTGVMQVTGSNTVSAGFSNAGTVTVGPFSSLALDGTSNNSGTLNLWANDGVINGFSALNVGGNLASTGTIELRGDAVSGYTATIGVTGSLANSGLIKSTLGGTGSSSPNNAITLNSVDAVFASTGTIQVDQSLALGGVTENQGLLAVSSGATLYVNSVSTFTNSTGGTIGGGGTINIASGTGTLVNDGTIAPSAFDATIPHTLTIQGNYSQGADGTLAINVSGALAGEYDQLVVTGSAILDGTLNASLVNDFVPSGALRFQVVTAASGITGDFSETSLPGGFSRLVSTNDVELVFGATSCAGTICWDNSSGDGLWTDPLNWNLDVLPGLSDIVVIDLGGGTFVVLGSGNYTIASLLAKENLKISGGSLSVTGASTFDGGLTLSGGSFFGTGAITANAATISSGNLGVARTALINALQMTGGQITGAGAVTVDGSLTATGGQIALNAITGSLSVTQAAGDLHLDIPVTAHEVSLQVASGSATMTNSLNEIGIVRGNVGGDFGVTDFRPLQLGDGSADSLTVGGNLVARSIAGSNQFDGTCALDSCIIVHGSISAGGSAKFYSNDLYIAPSTDLSPGFVSTANGDPVVNFVMWAPSTQGSTMTLGASDGLANINQFIQTPRLIFGDPDNLGAAGVLNLDAILATGGELGIIQKIEGYASNINFNGQFGDAGRNSYLPASVELNALNAINFGTSGFATMLLADNRSLKMSAGLSGTGDLTIGGGPGLMLHVGQTADNNGSMQLSGANVTVTAPAGSSGTDVEVSGTGLQSITATGLLSVISTGGNGVYLAGGSQIIDVGRMTVSAAGATSGGTVSVSAVTGTSLITVAGDLLIESGTGLSSNPGNAWVNSAAGQTVSAGSITIRTNGGESQTALGNAAGLQFITTTGANSSGWGIELSGNDAAAQNAGAGTQIYSQGTQSMKVANSAGISVRANTGAATQIWSEGDQSIEISGTGGNLLNISSDKGMAFVGSSGAQTVIAGLDGQSGGINLIAGSIDGANANLFGNSSQHVTTSGDLKLIGGTDPVGRASAVVNSNSEQIVKAKSITVRAIAGPVSSGFFTPSGPQTITTTGAGSNGYGITIENLGSQGTDQAGFAAAAFITTRTGAQTIDVSGSSGILIAGTGGDAVIDAEGPSQTITIHGAGANRLDMLAGVGKALVYTEAGTQTIIAGATGEAGSINLTGGSVNAAGALIRSNNATSGTQSVSTTGAITLLGGTAPGTLDTSLCTETSGCAVIQGSVVGLQTISAKSISLTGGPSGDSNLATIRGDGGQVITVVDGISLHGGSGNGNHNFAVFEMLGSASASQDIYFTGTAPVLQLTGGETGVDHHAEIISYGNQSINGSPRIIIAAGNSGGGPGSLDGNRAGIWATVGTQDISASRLDMTGGGGSWNDAYIGGGTTNITVTGKTTLTGGSGYEGLAGIGRADAPTTITLISADDIAINGGSADYSGGLSTGIGGIDAIVTVKGGRNITLSNGSAAGQVTGIGNDFGGTVADKPVLVWAGTGGVSGSITINDATIRSATSLTLQASAPGGTITQSDAGPGRVVAGTTLSTISDAGTTLAGPFNSVATLNALNYSSGDIRFVNSGGMELSGATNYGGGIFVSTLDGDLHVTGPVLSLGRNESTVNCDCILPTDGADGTAGESGGAAGDIELIAAQTLTIDSSVVSQGGQGAGGTSGNPGAAGTSGIPNGQAGGSGGAGGTGGNSGNIFLQASEVIITASVSSAGGEGGRGGNGADGGNAATATSGAGGAGGAGGNGAAGGAGGSSGTITIYSTKDGVSIDGSVQTSGGNGGSGGSGGNGGTGAAGAPATVSPPVPAGLGGKGGNAGNGADGGQGGGAGAIAITTDAGDILANGIIAVQFNSGGAGGAAGVAGLGGPNGSGTGSGASGAPGTNGNFAFSGFSDAVQLFALLGRVEQGSSGSITTNFLETRSADGTSLSGSNLVYEFAASNSDSGDINLNAVTSVAMLDLSQSNGNVTLTGPSFGFYNGYNYSVSGTLSADNASFAGATVNAGAIVIGSAFVYQGMTLLNAATTDFTNLTVQDTNSETVLAGNTAITVSGGDFLWYGGTIANTGGLVTSTNYTGLYRKDPYQNPAVASDVVLDTNWAALASGSGIEFTGDGPGNFVIGAGRTFTNQGLFTINGTVSSTATTAAITGTGTFLNQGTLAMAASGVTTDIRAPLINDDGGALSATAGVLNVSNLTQRSGGVIDAGSGAINIIAAFDWRGGSIDTGASVNVNDGAALSIASDSDQLLDGTLTVNGDHALSNLALGGAGTLVNLGSLSLDSVTLAPAVDNEGTLLVVGGNTSINGQLTQSGTLHVQGGGDRSPLLSVANSFTNNGLILLETGGDGSAANLELSSGTLTNASGGIIRSIRAGASGDSNQLTADVVNQGSMDVQHNLSVNTSDVFDSSAGALGIAAGQSLSVNGGTARIGGNTAFSGTGTFDVSLGGTQLDIVSDMVLPAAGWKLALGSATVDSSSDPVTLTNQGTLTLGGSNLITSNVNLDNQGTLLVPGSSEARIDGTFTQSGTLHLQGGNGSPVLTVANGFSNNGLILLEASSDGSVAQLTVTNGTLINESGATIRSMGSGAAAQNRIDAPVTNLGTIDTQHTLAVNVEADGLFDSSTGALNIAAGQRLYVTGGSARIGGETTFSGTGTFDVSNGGTQVQIDSDLTLPASGWQLMLGDAMVDSTDGTVTLTNLGTLALGSNLFTANVNVDNQGTLLLAGGKSASIGGELTQSGTLHLQGGGGMPVLTVANGFSNSGLILLDAGSDGSGAQLHVSQGTLTNASGGTIRSAGSSTGENQIAGAVLNQGAVDVQQGLTVSNGGSVFEQQSGTLTVADTKQFTLSGGTFSWTGGSLLGTGNLSLTGGASMSITGGSIKTLDGLTLVASSLDLTGPLNINSGSLSVTGAANIGTGGQLNINGGTFTQSGGQTFNNDGTVSVQTGSIVLDGGGEGTGSYSLGAGTQLNIANGIYSLGSVTGAGSVLVSGGTADVGTYAIPGTTTINAGNLNIVGTGTFGTLNVTGGSLGGAGSVTVATLNLSGGQLGGTGNLSVTSNFVQGDGTVGMGYQNLSLVHQGDFSVGDYSATATLSLKSVGGSLLINDVELEAPAITLSGNNVILQPTGDSGSFVDAANSLTVSTPGLLLLDGANGSVKLISGGSMNVNAGTVRVIAGNFSASIDPTTLNMTATGDIVLSGGSGEDAFAEIAADNVVLKAANLTLTGGSAGNNYAQVRATSGSAAVTVDNAVTLTPGTASDADAAIVAPQGGLTINALNCVGCSILAADPRGNAAIDQGLFGLPVALNLPSPAGSSLPAIEVDNSIIYAATLAESGGSANTSYSDDEEDKDKDKPGVKEEGKNGGKPKRNLPICM